LVCYLFVGKQGNVISFSRAFKLKYPISLLIKHNSFFLFTKFFMSICKKAIEENKKAVDDYKDGRNEALNFILGSVMKKTRGRADPKKAREMIIQQIKEE